jgi:pyruvate kinase
VLRTKIVCTIGPASSSPDALREMIRSGMDVARLNFSHGDPDYHAQSIAMIQRASAELGKPVAILADLQGPKLRVGKMQGDGVPLSEDEEIVLTTRSVVGRPGEIPVQYADLPRLVQPGERILIDDGMLELLVLGSSETEIKCRVVTGGLLESNKGMNLPHAHTSIAAITEKDRCDLRFALEHQADWVALSFVRSAEDVLALKGLIQDQCCFGRLTPVIAKIEKPEAVDAIDAIVAAADGIMVARGDLGIETSPEEVPLVQKLIIEKCNLAGIPVTTATQMLDSMIRNPRPTRAEASDVANAILDGSDAIMLSGETAVGKYPLEALRTMVRIAERAEASPEHPRQLAALPKSKIPAIAEAVSHATCETARDLDAAAIITPTASGYTARMIAKHRPRAPIVAVTPSPMVQRQLCLYWGIHPLLAKRTASTDEMLADAIGVAKERGFVSPGDVVVMTAGAAGSLAGTTNLIKVQVVERILVRGQGIGTSAAHGQVRHVGDALPSLSAVSPSDVLVVQKTTKELIPLAQRAAGLVVVEGGLDSHAATMARELGVTTILGALDARSALKDGEMVTLDPVRGLVYEGQVKV